MSAPTITQLRTAVVAQINAAGLGVTATPTWRAVRSLESLSELTVEVVITRIENEPETSNTAELNRVAGVLVRRRLDNPDDVAGADAVAELAETIGRLLLSNAPAVEADPMELEMDPVIDAEVLSEFGVAEAAVSVRYWSAGG